jgi:lycopene cyclase domain-containing protein
MGAWRFNEDYLVGIFIYNMPVEEVLFFICIPYACTFTYYCVDKFIRFKDNQKVIVVVNYVLMIALVAVGFTYFTRLYTTVTFSLLALFILIAMRKGFTKWKPFYVAYLLILFPFLLSNGILTGSFIEEPVVIYNNYENLNIRLFTIPVEDAFYAMLLMGMNVYGFERLRSRSAISTKL